MDDIRGSFSRLKKKLKSPLKGSARKLERTRSDAAEERVGQTSSLLRPEPHVVVGGDDDREGKGADADVDKSLRLDEPEPVLTGKSDNHQEGGEKDIGGREAGPSKRSGSHPDVKPPMGGEELEGAYPSVSATSNFPSVKPDGM